MISLMSATPSLTASNSHAFCKETLAEAGNIITMQIPQINAEYDKKLADANGS